MAFRGRLVRAGLALSLVSGSLMPLATPVFAVSQTLTIGVDNAGPAGRNFEYLDFYPRSGIAVHNLDVIEFKFNTASRDGFHTATLGKPGESAQQIAANNPIAVPDGDDSATQLQFPTSVFLPSHPPAPAPGGCGDAAHPCPYTGNAEINSGALCTGFCPNTTYFFQVKLPGSPRSPVAVNYLCLIHGPIMSGSFTVVPDSAPASNQASLNSAAAAQFRGQTAAGLKAARRALDNSETEENGTRRVNVAAGTESADRHVQVLEMLPASVTTTNGRPTVVTWTALSKEEIHTVTFPTGPGSNAVDPFPTLCEGSPADTQPTAGPPFFGCGAPGSPTALEIHFDPQPQGATAIATPTTVGSSGVIAAGGGPFPASYSFTFPNVGTSAYQCRIHDNMQGTIIIAKNGHDEEDATAPESD